MCTTIALLSGKGGSGKTTLALSIADLLRKCSIRTLLIDCDLSTNGATYFYESQLATREKNGRQPPLSFIDIINSNIPLNGFSIFEIDQYYHFIPSISDISNHLTTEELALHNYKDSIIHRILPWAQENYDVVIFDCQAGYTELLPILLPIIDIDLFVLEADSISASAMRSLHLKIGPFLGHARLYQVFNKATPEEFDIYSKIVGTFFTNIGTLLFDWKIRQAFSRSQVPNLTSTSAKFGSDLCSICKIILPDKALQEKLDDFSNLLLYQQLEEDRQNIESELYMLTKKPYSISKNTFMPLLIGLISVFTILIEFTWDELFTSQISSIAIMSTILLLITLIVTYYITDIFHETRKTRQQHERELKKIDAKLNELSQNIKRNVNN